MTSLEDSADSGWGTATPIETDDSEHALFPQVAVDASGNAIAVWHQQNYSDWGANIWWNRYEVGSGWGSATLMQTNDGVDAQFPQVAVDGSGNAIAVWYQDPFRNQNIWSNRYEVGSGWGIATPIGTDDLLSARSPQVDADGSGNAIAVWEETGYIVWGQDGIIGANIWANRYEVGSGWGSATVIDTDDSGSRNNPQVAVDDSGNAMAVWSQYDGTQSSIWSNRYVAGTGWGDAELIETNYGSGRPQVSMDGNGNAIAVWSKYNGTQQGIWANRYVVGVGWGDAQLIGTDNLLDVDAQFPQVAVGGSGNAIAVWSQDDGTQHSIWANRYVAGTGWGTATLIETNNSVTAAEPQVAVTASGNAVAVWRQSNGSVGSESTRLSIGSNQYVVGTGWGDATLIATEDSKGFEMHPQVAVDASGNAIAVWSQFDDTCYNVWSNRYVEPDATPSSLTSTVAVLVIMAVVASIVFFWLRKKTADKDNKSIEDEEPPPPHG